MLYVITELPPTVKSAQEAALASAKERMAQTESAAGKIALDVHRASAEQYKKDRAPLDDEWDRQIALYKARMRQYDALVAQLTQRLDAATVTVNQQYAAALAPAQQQLAKDALAIQKIIDLHLYHIAGLEAGLRRHSPAMRARRAEEHQKRLQAIYDQMERDLQAFAAKR